MSLSHPIWLLALLLLPLGLTVQHLQRRRTWRYAVRFPAAASLRAAAAEAPDRMRHVPLALLLAALATLSLALAGPRVVERVVIDQASVMLVTDHSGSMAADDVTPTRLAAAEQAADSFLSRLPRGVRVGAVAFSSTADSSQNPVTDHSAARAIIDGQSAGGATATGDALGLALELLHGAARTHPPSAIVLLSDGSANRGIDSISVARQAGRDRIPIYTVALGTPGGVLQTGDPFQPLIAVPPDPALMAKIANDSGGRTFDARTPGQLISVYGALSRELGTTIRRRDIAGALSGAGLVLLLLAGVGSFRLAGRLP